MNATPVIILEELNTMTSNGNDDKLYHVSKDGTFGVCEASEGNCPLSANGTQHVRGMDAVESLIGEMASKQPGKSLSKANDTGTDTDGGFDAEHARHITETAFSDEVLTDAPLASIPGVPARLQPLSEDFNDACSSWNRDWNNKNTKEFMQSIGCDLSKMHPMMVGRPVQRTYMGKSLEDGSDVIPPEGSPDRAQALNDLATEYDEKLYEVHEMYEQMKRAFRRDFRGEYIGDYSCPRMLAHWGRSLADEKAYIESIGGESSFKKPRYPESDERKARKEMHYRATGRKTLPTWGRHQPFTESELASDWIADKTAKEALLLQGRPRSMAKEMAEHAIAVRDDAKAEAIASGANEWQAYEAGRDAYQEALVDMYRQAPPSDQQITMIDIETTGLDPEAYHIQDVGWCSMSITDPNETITGSNNRRFGNGEELEAVGNPTTWLTGITTKDIQGKVPFDKDPKAQAELLEVLRSQPYMAHNARYEDGAFTAHVKGYAEAKRRGEIHIIDSMDISKKLDRYEGKKNNKLEDYAKHWGVISDTQGERHLGYEDAVVMGKAAHRNVASVFGLGGGDLPAFQTGRDNGVTYDIDGNAVTGE